MGRQAADLEQLVGLALDPGSVDRLDARPPGVLWRQLDDGRCVGGRYRLRRVASTYCLPFSFGSSASRRPSPRKVKLDQGEGDGDGREEHEVRIAADVLLAIGDQAAPRRARRLDADADVGQRRLGQDRAGDAEGDRDDDRARSRWAAGGG